MSRALRSKFDSFSSAIASSMSLPAMNKQVRDVTRSRTNCGLNSPMANSCSLCFMSDIELKLMSACTKPATRSTREPSCTLTALYRKDET